MKLNKTILYISIIYIVALLYVIFIQQIVGIVFVMLTLYFITIYYYFSIHYQLDQEKESSLGKVLKRLDKTEKQNEETYNQFLSLSKTIGSGVLILDVEGVITFSNKDIELYFGSDFNGKEYNEIAHIRKLYKFINKAYLTEEKQRKQISYKGYSFDLISTPIFENNLFSGIIVLVHDITLLKNAEKFQKRFTADVSHELRTPLAAIKGFSEILNRDQKMDSKDQKEFLDLIQKEAERMEIILSDLLVISKLDRLDYDLELNIVDIKDIVDESIMVLKSRLEDKKLKLKSNVEHCDMSLNKVKITQGVLNILKNAINYTDEGHIEIDGKTHKGSYILSIKDSGIGIPVQKQDLIFKRFYRIDKARSRDTGGSGLGLSITKNVILKHGGSITVESEEGKGSTFIITLPIER